MKNISISLDLGRQGINADTIDDLVSQEMQELAIVAADIQYPRVLQDPWRCDPHTPILKETITIPHEIYA